VLNLSKLSSGNVSLNLEPINPSSLVAAVIDMFASKARVNEINMHVDFPPPPQDEMCVDADPYRLSQVYINLVSNALKFTATSSVRKVNASLSFTSVPETPNNVNVVFSVRDTGIGMTPEEQASLFQRFRQANLKTYSRYGGSGLGLYISRMMLDLMKGDISVESTAQVGSTFTVSIPCAVAPPKPKNSREANVVTTSSTPFVRSIKAVQLPLASNITGTLASALDLPSPSGLPPVLVRSDEIVLSILVVEDNDINQRILKRQLEGSTDVFKCKTTVAENGLEAVNIFVNAEAKFDVVLMDVEMPVMGGLEATRRIRQIEVEQGRRRVPIIGLSGNVRDVMPKKKKKLSPDCT